MKCDEKAKSALRDVVTLQQKRITKVILINN